MKCIILKPKIFESGWRIELILLSYTTVITYINSKPSYKSANIENVGIGINERGAFHFTNIYLIDISEKIIKLLSSEDATIRNIGFNIIYRYPGKLHIKNLNQFNEIFNLEKKNT